MNVTATWIATNPLCGSNCTETMDLSYVFELNNGSNACMYPNCYGWVQMNTMQESSSGFLGSFAYNPSFTQPSGLWEDDGQPSDDGIPFFNAQLDEIDLGFMGPGLGYEKNFGPDLLIYNCSDCHDAYPGVDPEDIDANYATSTAVQMPAGDTEWKLLLASMFLCAAGVWVMRRLGLTPADLCTGVCVNC
jgi:hypothetical protein